MISSKFKLLLFSKILQPKHIFVTLQLFNMQYPVRSTYFITIFTLLLFVALANHKPAYLFDPQRASLIFQNNHPAAMLFLGDKDQSSSEFAYFSQLSNSYPDIMFIYSRKGHDHYLKVLQFIGVESRQPPILIYRNSKAEKFYYDPQLFAQMSLEHINQFISKSKQRLIEPFLKSRNSTEDLQDYEFQDNMKYLTYYNSYTLRDVLRTQEKQLILVIYGKWCFYSQKLSPHFTEVAKRLKNNQNLLFGKIDGNWNQIEGFEPLQHPTITFWNKNKSKQPIVYQDRRTADNIISWIKENTQYPWVQPLPSEKKIEIISNQEKQILKQPEVEVEHEAEAEDEEEYYYQDQQYYYDEQYQEEEYQL